MTTTTIGGETVLPPDMSNTSALNETMDYNGTFYMNPPEDDSTALFYYYLWVYAAPMAFGIMTLVGTVGNLLVVYVICSRKNMSTVTNLLLLNLAIADISFLVMCGPFNAYKYASFSWEFGDWGCKLFKFFNYWTTYVTVYTLVSISALRFLTVVCHRSSMGLRTKKNIIILNLIIWLLCGLANIYTALVHTVKNLPGFSYCGMVNHQIKPFYISFFVTGYLLPLCLICLLYVMIMCHLYANKMPTNPTKHDKSSSKDRTAHVFKVILIVVLIFGLSWLPLHVQSLVGIYGKVPNGAYYEVFRILWQCLIYANSCANPFVYNYVSQDFKKAFKEVISCGRQPVMDSNGNSTVRNSRYTAITMATPRGNKTQTTVISNGEIGETSQMITE